MATLFLILFLLYYIFEKYASGIVIFFALSGKNFRKRYNMSYKMRNGLGVRCFWDLELRIMGKGMEGRNEKNDSGMFSNCSLSG